MTIFIIHNYIRIIITLLILSNVYRPDAGLYHLPYIKFLMMKIIFGLANFHLDVLIYL